MTRHSAAARSSPATDSSQGSRRAGSQLKVRHYYEAMWTDRRGQDVLLIKTLQSQPPYRDFSFRCSSRAVTPRSSAKLKVVQREPKGRWSPERTLALGFVRTVAACT